MLKSTKWCRQLVATAREADVVRIEKGEGKLVVKSAG
jgi:hypothetical protein